MKKYSVIRLYSVVALVVMGILPYVAFGQLDAALTSTDNTNCQGAPCDYNGPSIIINELMMAPIDFDGSLWGGTAIQGGEWIELYNPNICEPIDISCFYLGNNANDSDPYPGGYVIPSGTVVPPAGFALIRGVNAEPVPTNLLVENGGNVIELVVDSAAVCVGGGSRLWFPNTGGWFAFYDNNGLPQDAVSWATQANTDQQPCVPTLAGCGFSGTLSNYDNFPINRKNYILNTSASDIQGQSIRRIPSGGVWSGAGTPTFAFTNAPPPNPPIIICNGTALAEPFGGNPPYTFLWDDPQAQTTQTAEELCAGVYCVLITDASNDTTSQCVTVDDYTYEAFISDGLCPGGSYTLPDNSVVTEPGDYPVYFQTGLGCDSLITLSLSFFPTQNYEINKQICENHTYILPDGTEVGVTGTYQLDYQNIFGCDSNYTVNLIVTNPIHMSLDTLFCEGTPYVLPDGSETSAEGFYEILVPGDPTSCDTLFAVTLAFHPGFQINIEEQNDISCFGETDGSISLSVSGTTSPYVYVWSDGLDHDSIAEALPPGEYIINVSDLNGCEKEVSVVIYEPTAIELSLSGDTLICLGSQSQLLVEGNGGTGSLIYHWNTTYADSGNIAVAPIDDTTYSVYAEDENGCISEPVETVVSVILMDIGLLSLTSDTTICPEDSVSIYGSYSGNYPPYEFNWSGGIGNGQGPHYVSLNQPMTYVLTVSDVCGNTVSEDVLVDLFESPESLVPDQLISGCSPLEIELYDPINTASDYTHEWVLSNTDTYFGNPVNFILEEPGIYEVSLIVTSPAGCSATSQSTMPIEVYELPLASFTASSWSTSMDEPEIIFSDNSAGNVFNSWTIDGSVFVNQSEITYAFADTGVYAIQLIIENEFGCRDSLTQWVNINVGYVVDVPNAFTPAVGSGDNPYFDPTSTTNTVFYPFMEYVEEYKMSIFNRWGELIFESTEEAKGWNGTYRDKPCPQDVYVYKIELEYSDGKKATKVGDIALFR